jgi:hypothetical protein
MSIDTLKQIEDPHCISCGSHAVDTGWECTDCGCDMGPILSMLASTTIAQCVRFCEPYLIDRVNALRRSCGDDNDATIDAEADLAALREALAEYDASQSTPAVEVTADAVVIACKAYDQYDTKEIDGVAHYPSIVVGPADSSQGEDFCELCGGPNIKPWFAPSPIWNKVANDHSVLCPQCFVALARRVGIDPVWRLAPDDYTGPDDDPERMAGRENVNKAEPSGLGSVDSADLPNVLSPATPPPSSPQVAVAKHAMWISFTDGVVWNVGMARDEVETGADFVRKYEWMDGLEFSGVKDERHAAPTSAPKAAEPVEPQARHWRGAIDAWWDLPKHPIATDEALDWIEQRARSLAQVEQAAKGDK